jgi:hypothetical protein
MNHNPLKYFVALDLGPAGEYTSLAIVERADRYIPPHKPVYNLRHLKRFDIGTPYPAIVNEVASILSQAPMPGAWFIVDHTGVGRMVLKLFRERLENKVRCTFCPVSIIASNVLGAIPQSELLIPKQELVGTLQVLLQTRRLQVANGLPETTELVRELESYRLKPLKLAGESDEMWREGPRDDLVLAVALAAWCGEKRLPVTATVRG